MKCYLSSVIYYGNNYMAIGSRAVLEISLSSFQTVCCRGLLQCAYGGIFAQSFQ